MIAANDPYAASGSRPPRAATWARAKGSPECPVQLVGVFVRPPVGELGRGRGRWAVEKRLRLGDPQVGVGVSERDRPARPMRDERRRGAEQRDHRHDERNESGAQRSPDSATNRDRHDPERDDHDTPDELGGEPELQQRARADEHCSTDGRRERGLRVRGKAAPEYDGETCAAQNEDGERGKRQPEEWIARHRRILPRLAGVGPGRTNRPGCTV